MFPNECNHEYITVKELVNRRIRRYIRYSPILILEQRMYSVSPRIILIVQELMNSEYILYPRE